MNETSNELYLKFQNLLQKKDLICFGIGAIFWSFLHNYKGKKIKLLIDNTKCGEHITIKQDNYIIQPVNEIKTFNPNEVVVLITAGQKIQQEMKEQLHALGYFNIFCWTEIDAFSKRYYDDVNRYLLTYSADQMNRSYNLKIAHISIHCGGNAGDTVLNYCIRALFEKIIGNCLFDIYSIRDSVNTENIINLNHYDAIIIGGGGVFLPDSNKNKISGWQWACSNELMSQIEKPLIGFAIGYNYFEGQQPNEMFINSLKHFVHKTKFLGIRNKRSINIINELLQSSEGDISKIKSIMYQPCATTFMEKYINLPEKHKTNNVAINIALDRPQLRFGNSTENVLMEFLKAIQEIHDNGYNIFITAHCKIDLMFEQYLYSSNFYDFETVDMSDMSPIDIINFYRNMDLVISSRGHGSMIPFGLGTKIISIGSHKKLKAFLDDIDATDWFIDISDVNTISTRLIRTFNNIMDNEENVINRIHEAQNQLFEITVNNLQNIKKFI